jgi:D-glycero-alpha-D-manno-heptose 1-phosphate guanylyltransferase
MTGTAIILAGGLGTRLRTVVAEMPKCMAPVAGKPFIAYVIDHLLQQGIHHFIFALGYKNEAFNEYLSSQPGLNYTLSIEPQPLGTGGAIRLACNHAKEKTVLVMNGDTLFKVQVDKLIGFHDMCGAHCTLSLKPMPNVDRYGTVELNKDYSIRSFKEKQFYEHALINGGAYALHAPKFLQEDLPEKFSFEKDYLEQFFDKRRMFGVVQDEYFIDIGIPEDYQRAQHELSMTQ